jgi:hypothetical protein
VNPPSGKWGIRSRLSGQNLPEALAFERMAGENAFAEKPWDVV